MFVHGFACSHEDWKFQLETLQKKSEVVACDLRGHGATPGRPHECSIEHYGGDVVALLANLEFNDCILIGHSMGCRVVLETARLVPERVSGLILVDGSRIGSGDPASAESAARAAVNASGYRPFAKSLFEQMFLVSSAQSRAIVERAMQLTEEVGAALWPRMVRWDAERLDQALAAVSAPLLVVQSTWINADRKRLPLERGATSPWLDLMRHRVPGARVEIVSGVGHFPQLEAATAVNRLIQEFAAARR